MKPVMILMFLSVTLLALPPGWSRGRWAHDRMLQEVKSKNIPMMVYFYAEWCPYCRKLDYTLLNRSVRSFLNPIPRVAINSGMRNKSHQLEKLMKKYNVTGYPSLFIHYPNGYIAKIYISKELSQSPKKLLNLLKRKIPPHHYKRISNSTGIRPQKYSKRSRSSRGGKARPKTIDVTKIKNSKGSTPTVIFTNYAIKETPEVKRYNTTGQTLITKKQYKKALQQFWESISKETANPTAWFGIGHCHLKLADRNAGYQKKNHLKKAQKFYQKAFKYYVSPPEQLRKELSEVSRLREASKVKVIEIQ